MLLENAWFGVSVWLGQQKKVFKTLFVIPSSNIGFSLKVVSRIQKYKEIHFKNRDLRSHARAKAKQAVSRHTDHH